MKLTEKGKRRLAIGAGAVICVGLIFAISLQFAGNPAEATSASQGSSEAAVEVHTEPITQQAVETEAEEKKLEEKEAEELAETDALVIHAALLESIAAQPLDTRPAQTDETEQSIQPQATKPEEPAEAVKTDPSQTPDGTAVEEPPVPVDHEAVETTGETTAAAGQPQAGNVQDGKTYVPGFGYVENSGPNNGGTLDDMYENGNKIGIMD